MLKQLFYSTQIPVCLWFLTRNKSPRGQRDRRSEVLFIDARNMGTLLDRVHRELSDEDMAKIAGAYRDWKSGDGYEDVPGLQSLSVKAQGVREREGRSDV